MTNVLVNAALAIGASLALSIIVKATVLLAFGLSSARFAWRARASVRHALLVSLFSVLLALPVLAAFAPVTVHVAKPEVRHPILSVSDGEARTVGDGAGLVGSTEDARGVAAYQPSRSTWAWLAIVWASGASLFLLPLIVGVWQLWRQRRDGVPWLEGQEMVRGLGAAAGICRPIAVLLHEEATSPMTAGFARPVIVLPTDVHTWSRQELRQAVIHELEHVRRGDWLIRLIARMVCAMYWFHPLVWAAWRRLALEAERACDDAVLLGADATGYAEQLVTLAARLTARGARPALAMANPTDLSARVSALLDLNQARGRAGIRRVAIIVAAMFVPMLALSPLRAVSALKNQSQTVDAKHFAFEVGSVKANKSGDRRTSMRLLPGGRIEATNRTLRLLIKNAYQLQDLQIAGGPDWLDDARFDISAKAEGNPTQVELQSMLRTLLVDRFKLATHTEPRELQIYSLGLVRPDATLGPQLRTSDTGCLDRLPNAPPPKPPEPPPAGQAPLCGFREGIGTMVARGVTMAQLAEDLTGYVSRPVLDRTGLRGTFDLTLSWTPDQLPSPGGEPSTVSPSVDPNVPSIFTAIREQLGLKLESTKGPVDVLVIDRAQKPMED